MFLPSILEYSPESLQQKLELLTAKSDLVNEITGNTTDSLALHLDFVQSGFAKDRVVMQSLGFQNVFTTLHNLLHDRRLSLSLHLMADSGDLGEAYNFFQDLEINPNWEYLIFVPEKYYDLWQQAEFKQNPTNLKIGIWYDLDEWNSKEFSLTEYYLLMTVVAGKSGQSLDPQVAASTLEISRQNPDTNFILDGGWSVDTTAKIPGNCNIVSYSSFWKKLEN